ncbi:DUF3859 domain-containing protein [Pseudooceanicola algae]|uniref:DUF3859 domain-containing protein n=1 Tax=Pseudooceanicola algae TaxID=1537215 RepID=A0A418SKP4_9RHOB|nr:DUF3859 domain-containing protein [Pseudooceanicola algae]QPM91014.1 hypothetical protein PSAL_022570 [Pseudooceanicola algae]
MNLFGTTQKIAMTCAFCASVPAMPMAELRASAVPSRDFVSAPIELEEAGVYCPVDHVGRAAAPDTESGYILLMEGDQRVALHSRVVPASLGISFGVRIRHAPGAPMGNYRMVVTHPPYGPRNISVESWDPNISTGWGVRSFQFEYDRELQVGPWSMELYQGDDLLMRQSFQVVPPQEAPEAIEICFGGTFIS